MAQHANPIRHGTVAHRVLGMLVHAGATGLRRADISTGHISAPGKQIRLGIDRLMDNHLVTELTDCRLCATAAGAALLHKIEGRGHGAARTHAADAAHLTPPPLRGWQPRGDDGPPPLVLRPGADDHRKLPSRQGNRLFYTYADGRVEALA